MVDLLIEGSTQPTPGVSHLAKVGPSWAREIGTDSVSLFLPGSWCLGLNLLIGVAPLPFQLGPVDERLPPANQALVRDVDDRVLPDAR